MHFEDRSPCLPKGTALAAKARAIGRGRRGAEARVSAAAYGAWGRHRGEGGVAADTTGEAEAGGGSPLRTVGFDTEGGGLASNCRGTRSEKKNQKNENEIGHW